MLPRKSTSGPTTDAVDAEPASPQQTTEESQTAPSQTQAAIQPTSDAPQTPPRLSNDTEDANPPRTDVPQTPEKSASNDVESPFRALRHELGLSKVEVPALRPRRKDDNFEIRLRPGAVRNEDNLQAAINEIIYNEDRVQAFMRLALTPAEATSVRDLQAAQVLSHVTDETLTLRDALWYLEYADWDVELAILHHMHDHIDRTEAPGPDSVQVKHEFAIQNLDLDRAPARAGRWFDKKKFQVHFVQYGRKNIMTYPLWLTFDHNDINQIRALNTWRWKLIMEQVGLRTLDRRRGASYNPLERLWIHNYERDNPMCTSRELTDQFNATFAGAMLPGETQPRPTRSLSAIACLRNRALERRGDTGKRKRTATEAGFEEREGGEDKQEKDDGNAWTGFDDSDVQA